MNKPARPLPDYLARNRVFQNPQPPHPSGALKTLKLFWQFFFNKPAHTRPDTPPPVMPLSCDELQQAPDNSLWRLGHSTVLLKLAGDFFLTDPVFAERASPVQWAGPRRFHAPPLPLAALPPLKAVVLSHDHYDHLDKAAVKALANRTELFITPTGVGDLLVDWGLPAAKIRQFDWWQSTTVGSVTLSATPSQHFSGRGLRDGNKRLWCSWVLSAPACQVFFSGDSGYFDGFKAIGERFGPFDITLMETGAYDPNWPAVHMQPKETLQAHLDLAGRWLLPIHNGTFDLAMHAWFDPFEQMLALADARQVALSTPSMGERLDITAPHSGQAWWRPQAQPQLSQAGLLTD
ncbi:MBL fold metallo-hydrolase [Gallaecimonas sp. GXIMD1310]|uniref:MBL fold metallo-hydrolase n=1 Tax=Gallaecimonas sp. GXIMD1310 TaxID=3131926 RepID=UPI00324FB2A4